MGFNYFTSAEDLADAIQRRKQNIRCSTESIQLFIVSQIAISLLRIANSQEKIEKSLEDIAKFIKAE